MRLDAEPIADIRAMRREDNTIAEAAEERAGRRASLPGGAIDAVGLQLLHDLWIEEAS
jgi:hypothetical protein